jgi:hypothetical protein
MKNSKTAYEAPQLEQSPAWVLMTGISCPPNCGALPPSDVLENPLGFFDQIKE